MRGAIERVIEELEIQRQAFDHAYDEDKYNPNRDYFDGAGDGVGYALTKLKEVLRQHDTNTQNQQHAPHSE